VLRVNNGQKFISLNCELPFIVACMQLLPVGFCIMIYIPCTINHTYTCKLPEPRLSIRLILGLKVQAVWACQSTSQHFALLILVKFHKIVIFYFLVSPEHVITDIFTVDFLKLIYILS
jgi:hypothetical protein